MAPTGLSLFRPSAEKKVCIGINKRENDGEKEITESTFFIRVETLDQSHLRKFAFLKIEFK